MAQFNQMYALLEGRQKSVLREFRQHKLIDRLFINATSLNAWRTEYTFGNIMSDRNVYTSLYAENNETKSWRGTTFHLIDVN